MEGSKEKLSLEQAFKDMGGEVIGIVDLAELLGKLDEESLKDFMAGKLYDYIDDYPEIGITLPLNDLYSVYSNLRKWAYLFSVIELHLNIDVDSRVDGFAFRKIRIDMDHCADGIFHVIK